MEVKISILVIAVLSFIPILKTEDEFWSLDDSKPSVNEVKDVPANFKEWINENSDRIESAEKKGTLPYFIKDNKRTVEEVMEDKDHSNEAQEISPALIAQRRLAYQKYEEKGWYQLYFDENTGGFNVAHPLHQFRNSKPKGVLKTGGEAEKWLGIQLARQGKAIEFLPESGINGKSGDLFFDGLVWDCKYIPLAKEETIRAYFKDSRKADCVIFTFEEIDRYDDIMKAINREIGRYRSQGREINELPDVYIIDKTGTLRLIKKIKGT